MKIVQAEQTALATVTDLEVRVPDALEAVRLFAQTGSLARVAAELKCSLYELKKLTRTEFWQRELHDLQIAEAAELNVRMTRLFNSTLEQLEDRLQNGDFILGAGMSLTKNEKGELVSAGGALKRVPLPASTLARVAEIVFDKRQLVRQLPTSIMGVGENSKLEQLGRQLRALGAKDPDLLSEAIIEIPAREMPGQESALRSAANS